MFSTLTQLVKTTVKSIFSGIFAFEKKIFFFFSIIFLTNSLFRAFICSYLMKQSQCLTFVEACLWMVGILLFVWLYRRFKLRKKKLSAFGVRNYLYMLSSYSQANPKLSINSTALRFKLLSFNWFDKIFVNVMFARKFLLSSYSHVTNSNSYAKLNKNYRRYAEILKRYI